MPSSSKCVSTQDLYEFAHRMGHSVDSFPLSAHPSLEILDEDGCHIAMRPGLRGWEEKHALAHALGHCETMAFYTQNTPSSTIIQCEGRARNWEYEKLLPVSLLGELIRDGNTEYWQIAEEVECPVEFVTAAVAYYKDKGVCPEWRSQS